ncbi:hypothetical protein HanRHA438_Chr01g0020781 [Helianthus annuus]|nr:hypothetical protein HanIR_Chr01g0021981 [Helianthus annuus]KAJ0947866.1 hypothetical protein HanRHA438_Chr01g0020781 [Helianthus annuus]
MAPRRLGLKSQGTRQELHVHEALLYVQPNKLYVQPELHLSYVSYFLLSKLFIISLSCRSFLHVSLLRTIN